MKTNGVLADAFEAGLPLCSGRSTAARGPLAFSGSSEADVVREMNAFRRAT